MKEAVWPSGLERWACNLMVPGSSSLRYFDSDFLEVSSLAALCINQPMVSSS